MKKIAKYNNGDSINCSLMPSKILKVKGEPEWNGISLMYSFQDTDLRCGEEYLSGLTNYQKLLISRALNEAKNSHQAISVPNREAGLNLLLIKRNNAEFIFDKGGNVLIQTGDAESSFLFWRFLSELCEGAIHQLQDEIKEEEVSK